MKVAIGCAVLVAVALAASACGSSKPATAPAGSSTRLILGGAVRCTATVASPVQAGQALKVSLRYDNLTDRRVTVDPAYGGTWVVVKSADGTTYDTRIPLENSTIPPRGREVALAPKASATSHLLQDLRVRWEEPLRVTAGCGTFSAPPIRVAVSSPGAPASPKDAVAAVVSATGHLLDHCRPSSPGVAVPGRIDAPDHRVPPLAVHCSVSLQTKKGFDLAQVLVASSLRPVPVDPLYEQITGPPSGPNQIAVAWQFVVTKNGATPVAAAHFERSTGRGHAPDWTWSPSGPGTHSSGDNICGSAGGGGGLSPIVEFVSACR